MRLRPYFHRPHEHAVIGPWTLPALCAAYGLPRNLTGGNRIGIIELGGAFSPLDMALFCHGNGMPVPKIINPTSPFASDPFEANVEVMLDVEVAAFVNWWCTGKVPTIELIWDQSGTIYQGILQAISSKPSTISNSWGAAADEWTPSDAAAVDAAGWAAGEAGTAVLAATGDADFGDGETGAHVDLPASAPSIIGCSGTTKTHTSETCWNNGNGEGTGGGFSTIWKRPKWQSWTPRGKPRHWSRAVGDVSANADPNTGYQIICGGRQMVIGGTSASAPFWAGLLAAIKAQPGFCTWKMYQKRQQCFVPVTQGDNGKFPASIVNGLGVPSGATIATLLD